MSIPVPDLIRFRSNSISASGKVIIDLIIESSAILTILPRSVTLKPMIMNFKMNVASISISCNRLNFS